MNRTKRERSIPHVEAAMGIDGVAAVVEPCAAATANDGEMENNDDHYNWEDNLVAEVGYGLEVASHVGHIAVVLAGNVRLAAPWMASDGGVSCPTMRMMKSVPRGRDCESDEKSVAVAFLCHTRPADSSQLEAVPCSHRVVIARVDGHSSGHHSRKTRKEPCDDHDHPSAWAVACHAWSAMDWAHDDHHDHRGRHRDSTEGQMMEAENAHDGSTRASWEDQERKAAAFDGAPWAVVICDEDCGCDSSGGATMRMKMMMEVAAWLVAAWLVAASGMHRAPSVMNDSVAGKAGAEMMAA